MRAAFLALLIPFLASAQIQDLATTDDGVQVYFSSTLRLKGSDQYTSPKIFRFTDGRFELFRQEKFSTPFLGSGKSNAFQLVSPDVSGDGQLVAYTGIANCSGGSSCIAFVRNTGYLVSANADPGVIPNGTLRISRDKRFALRFGGDTFLATKNALIELSSGAQTDLSRYNIIGDGRQSLADNGVVLLDDNGSVSLWRNGTAKPTGIPAVPLLARVDRNAGTIVYETSTSLVSHNLTSGREMLLAEHPSSSTPSFRPFLSSDGTLVLYLEGSQAVIQLTNGSGKRQLTHDLDGIVEAVLSGNGNAAYAVTGGSGLLRIDVASGAVTQILSSPPQIRELSSLAAGSFSRLTGANLLNADVRIGSVAPPILARLPSEIDIQIPWETFADADSVILTVSNQSAFESAFDILVATVSPRFEGVAIHQAFDGLVTADSPAKAGEIIHFYLTGLGAVVPPVATGQVTPATELHRTTGQPDCSFAVANRAVPAAVLFTGLAPGLIGIDQMDVMMPGGIIHPITSLTCVFPLRFGTATIVANNIAVAP